MRLLTLLAAGLVLGLTFAGCAPGSPAASTPPPPTATTKPASPPELTIAVAANFRPAAEELAPLYKQATGTELRLTFGSSGNFAAQIQNGAPFDVFLSADMDYPQKLMDAGQAVTAAKPYAIGKLVLWALKSSPIDVEKLGLQSVLQPSVKKIAIANPATAPYGSAAVAVLKQAGLYDQVQGNIVLGDSVAQAAQFVQSGAADIGFFAYSQALDAPLKDNGRMFLPPPASYPRIEQGAIVLKTSKYPEAGAAFLAFLSGPVAAPLLTKFGYEVPP